MITKPVRYGDSQICPVCNGEGSFKKQRCHGCEGKGWIIVWRDLAPVVKALGIYEGSNPYSDINSPLFSKGAPPPVFFSGCAAGCHTGKHKHHTTVPYIYGDPYAHKCARCGYPASDLSYGGRDVIYLCDCCWQDWEERYRNNININTFIREVDDDTNKE